MPDFAQANRPRPGQAHGENVAAAVSQVANLPISLNPPLPDADVRGEVYLSAGKFAGIFAGINDEREAGAKEKPKDSSPTLTLETSAP